MDFLFSVSVVNNLDVLVSCHSDGEGGSREGMILSKKMESDLFSSIPVRKPHRRSSRQICGGYGAGKT